MFKKKPQAVYFMNFRQGYINIHKKAKETGETRGKKRQKERRRK